MSKRIAVIGSGIAGLSAAWLLSKHHEVILIEKQRRLGGHAHTVEARTQDGAVPIDMGFIVYNEQNYPNLTALFARLDVPTASSDMGFAVSTERGRMEYCGRRLNGLFAQRRNVLRMRHWQMIADILRFFHSAKAQAEEVGEEMTIGAFLEHFGYSEAFIEDHILPMSAAIWSTPARSMLEFPAQTFIRFFANHGLLQVNNRPQWRTVRGGAREYVDRLVADGAFTVLTGQDIVSIRRDARGAELVFADGQRLRVSEVVMACHADTALSLLGDASPAERGLLSAFRSTDNRAVLHTDTALMPQRKSLWSAWNYLRAGDGRSADLSLTYWMNRLQPLRSDTNLFVTLNPVHELAAETVQAVVDFRHPLFDRAALEAQRGIDRIQGERHTWFAGAWLGYGFHEDGLHSGLTAAERIAGVNRPWHADGARRPVTQSWTDDAALQRAAE